MQNNYLIPANTKKSQYILGFFKPMDLFIFIPGCVISLILLLIIPDITLGLGVLIMTPALIATFLVMPVPHYHNVLQLLINIVNFFMNRRRYYWRGWSIYERFNTSDKRF